MFKFLEKFALTELLLAICICLVASIAFVGCTQPGGVKEQRAQQEKIATACKAINVAGNAIALHAEQAPAGEDKVKAKALAAQALVVVRPTKDFCEPKPATYLNPTDFAALLAAAADLAMKKKEIVP